MKIMERCLLTAVKKGLEGDQKVVVRHLEQHGPVCVCVFVCVCECLKLCSAMIVAFKVHKVNKSLVKAHIVEEKGLSVRVMFKCLLHLLEPETL